MAESNRLLPVIGGFKLLKAIFLLTIALGFRHLTHGDTDQILHHWAHDIRIDPDSRYAHRAISAMTGVPVRRLKELEIGTCIYGMLFATEGTGLVLGYVWAEWLTVVSTLGFLPLEFYELLKPDRRAMKAALLIANVAIAAYLIWNLLRKRKPAKTAVVPTESSAATAAPVGALGPVDS